MIITKADIGRIAVSKCGEEWVFKGNSPDKRYPLLFGNGGIIDVFFAEDGTFDHDAESKNDLIRWADETEGAQ
jgi:hypothetical protein